MGVNLFMASITRVIVYVVTVYAVISSFNPGIESAPELPLGA